MSMSGIIARVGRSAYANLMSEQPVAHFTQSRTCALAANRNTGSSFTARQQVASIRDVTKLKNSVTSARSVRTACHAPSAASTFYATSASDNDSGVAVSAATLECIHSAFHNPAFNNLIGPFSDKCRLLLACLDHTSCNDLRKELEEQGTMLDELKSTLKHGLKVLHRHQTQQAAPAAASMSPAKQFFDSELFYDAMRYAVEHDSDVVEPYHLLICLTDMQNGPQIAMNPLWYAEATYGYNASSKVMSSWMNSLKKAIQSNQRSSNAVYLPPHIPPPVTKIFRNAVSAVETPDDVAQVVEAYRRLNWVPDKETSTFLWRKLREHQDAQNPTYVLESLVDLPTPHKQASHAHAVMGVLQHRISAVVGSNDHPSWTVLHSVLSCLARYERAFPGALAKFCQQEKGDSYLCTLINKAQDKDNYHKHLTELYDLATKRQDQTPVSEIYEAVRNMARLAGEFGPSEMDCWLELFSKLRQQRPEDVAFLEPSPVFQWLWHSVLHILPYVDLKAAWYLTDNVVKLQMPTDRYGVLASHALLQSLNKAGKPQSGNELAAYLILVDRAAQWGRAAGEQFKE